MNKRVLILHGLGGSDNPHWQAQLAADLIKENSIVSFPVFPNKNNPNLSEWKENLRKEIEYFTPEIVICHSLANVLWFHTCDELDISLEKLMLVAPVSRTRVVKEAQSFYPFPIAKDLKAKDIIMFASTNDPYLSEEEAIELKEALNIDIDIMKNAGHINADSGFGSHDFALKWLRKEENNKAYI